MPLYQVLDPQGILLLTPAAQDQVPPGAVVYLCAPPSAPPDAAVPPSPPGYPIPPGSAYAGYSPPASPGDPGYVPRTLQGIFTAQALAAGRITPLPPSATPLPAPPPLPGAYLTPGCPPPGSVPAPAPPSPASNRLLYRSLNGQPGLHVATAN